MEKKIKDLTVNEFQLLVNQSVRKAFEDMSEDILALSSEHYIKSIEDARNDFREGNVKSFEDVFNV